MTPKAAMGGGRGACKFSAVRPGPTPFRGRHMTSPIDTGGFRKSSLSQNSGFADSDRLAKARREKDGADFQEISQSRGKPLDEVTGKSTNRVSRRGDEGDASTGDADTSRADDDDFGEPLYAVRNRKRHRVISDAEDDTEEVLTAGHGENTILAHGNRGSRPSPPAQRGANPDGSNTLTQQQAGTRKPLNRRGFARFNNVKAVSAQGHGKSDTAGSHNRTAEPEVVREARSHPQRSAGHSVSTPVDLTGEQRSENVNAPGGVVLDILPGSSVRKTASSGQRKEDVVPDSQSQYFGDDDFEDDFYNAYFPDAQPDLPIQPRLTSRSFSQDRANERQSIDGGGTVIQSNPQFHDEHLQQSPTRQRALDSAQCYPSPDSHSDFTVVGKRQTSMGRHDDRPHDRHVDIFSVEENNVLEESPRQQPQSTADGTRLSSEDVTVNQFPIEPPSGPSLEEMLAVVNAQKECISTVFEQMKASFGTVLQTKLRELRVCIEAGKTVLHKRDASLKDMAARATRGVMDVEQGVIFKKEWMQTAS